MSSEEIAVDAVKRVCYLTKGFVKPKIPVGDKDVSFDGYLLLKNEPSERVEAYEYEIPVQVKSKEVEVFSEGITKYSIRVKDIINYNRRGGCVYFVGEISPDLETKIFYKTFLPILQIRSRTNEKATNKTGER